MKNKTIIITSTFAIAFLCIIFTVVLYPKSTSPTFLYLETNHFSETVTVVADKDFEPYSFIDQSGNPTGHDIEFIHNLAPILKKNIKLRLLAWEDCKNAIRTGQADLILGLVPSPDTSLNVTHSIPLNRDFFVFFGKSPVSNFVDVYNKKIAYLTASESTAFLKPYKLDTNATDYSTYKEAFDSVARGENDYVIASYAVGRRFSVKHDDIEPVGPHLLNKMFTIGVSNNNKNLIDDIDSAIIQVRKNGTMDYLQSKWLGKYIDIIKFEDILKQYIHVAFVFGFIIFIAVIAFIYSKHKKSISASECKILELLDIVARDPLTNLYNRSSAESIVNNTIAHTKHPSIHAFFMIDIDNFKPINDTLGHHSGDKAIVSVATTLRRLCRDNDIVSRIGGDEFVVFMANCKNVGAVEKKASELANQMKKISIDSAGTFKTSISIGIALYPKHGNSYLGLYKAADSALYKVKNSSKGSFALADDNPEQ